MPKTKDIILIKPRVHTGDFHSAGGELIDYGLRISEWAYRAADDMNSGLYPQSQQELVRIQVNPIRLNRALRLGWKNADWSTSRLLVSVGALNYPPEPPTVDSMAEYPAIEVKPKPISIKIPIERFYEDLHQRLTDLNKSNKHLEDGSINWLKHIYTENFLLKTAVYEGVYLV